MWHYKDNKSSKNKYNNSLIYLDCLTKEVQENKRFIPVAITFLKTPPATNRLLAWIHQTLGMGPVDQQEVIKKIIFYSDFYPLI